MSGWDAGKLFYADILTNTSSDATNTRNLEEKCNSFFEDFRLDNQFIYREQIRRNVNARCYFVVVDLSHISIFDEYLLTQLQRYPSIVIRNFEQSAKNLARKIGNLDFNTSKDPLINFQVQLISNSSVASMRSLDSSFVSKLVRISGIVVSASSVTPRPITVFCVCKSCSDTKLFDTDHSFGSSLLPKMCYSSQSQGEANFKQKCPNDPYIIIPEKSICADQQTLKLQEIPDLVPVGELPRHITVIVDRALVNRICPGTRIIVTGIFSISHDSNNNTNLGSVKSSFIKALGIQFDDRNSDGYRKSSELLVKETDEVELSSMAQKPDFTDLFCSSIAPSIFGNLGILQFFILLDIKKALACLLVGGSSKRLSDNIRLRGDINVLLLGDPGTAKSQLLKFIEKVSPISVYTSGKGSSAAGLTASVIRDKNSGEFYLEGGAMVLADGGVVCIDEFDKMNDEDRVAIHEAMEQQTISIAKAGITTILNSRSAVLAAANPVFGRYDEMRAPNENIDFSATILSRFDMIFILKDEHSLQKDIDLAKHVLSIHMNGESKNIMNESNHKRNELTIDTMRKYISFVRQKCAPRISEQAANRLINHYVSMRSDVNAMENLSGDKSSIPLTIRQLEAIIRISEAIAKLSYANVASEQHVSEALHLFKVSTLNAVKSGHSVDGIQSQTFLKNLEKIESYILKRIAVGSICSYNGLISEMVVKGYPEASIHKTIDSLVHQTRFTLKSNRKMLLRKF